ncbi:hypothetical protein SAMN05660284_02333 [Formivibrio citricus]|uniref:Alpha/beta hydrolase family protein n=1 Tax=Formivibrio citricus TaxID=83765 RepID=A0A1I5C4M3_9NEIS|nr:hypothetical protein [Formivibrio citricus]SFN81963.1 hypothetical protein SAMN05660284_02333 [Formivibrio citricus]
MINKNISLALAAHLLVFTATTVMAQSSATPRACGEVMTINTHGNSTTRYTLSAPQKVEASVVLLAGGGGVLDLDANGCPQALEGNSLVRSAPLFNAENLLTALVDAPSDYSDGDGLAGFRNAPQHAEDLGKIIADLRARTNKPVWVIGTSRGSISAANAAARLSGKNAPDGVILTSVLTVGSRGQKDWVAQTVFDLPLESIEIPLLMVGHAADQCLRSPASLMSDVAARTRSKRLQIVTVTGGPGATSRRPTLSACMGRSPHGFFEQEAEVTAGIARFIRGASY